MKTNRNLPRIKVQDAEIFALATCQKEMSKLGFDGQWRVLNYLLTRNLGRSWALVRPASDIKP